MSSTTAPKPKDDADLDSRSASSLGFGAVVDEILIHLPDKSELIYISRCQKLVGELKFIGVITCPWQRYSMHSVCYRVI